MTSEMTAGDLPVPPIVVGGEAPADAMPEASPEEERRRRRKRALLLLLLGLLAMLVTIAIWYLIVRQPITPPLPLIPDSQLPAYSTAIYGIQRPAGVAVSPSGDRIYVTQSAGDRTGIVFDGAGNKIGTMTPPPTTGTDHSPVYIAVDPLTSEVYVSDRLAGTIYVYDRDGLYQRDLRLAKPRPGWQPLGLAFDKAGTLYATDMSGPYQKVLVIDRSANVVRTIGENDNLNFPNGVGVDDAGTVYVTDGNNGRLLAFDAQGRISGQVGRGTGQGNLGLPRGLAVDDKGRIFVADATGQGVFVFRGPSTDSRRFDFLGFLGGEGVGDAQFEYPNATAIDARGRMYVADTYNDRVQIWSY
jgi:DNA-binding beta-propeller fold protein YncE